MTTQRPASEQFNLQPSSKSNPQYRSSTDLSHLAQQPTNHRGSRPASEIFPPNTTYHSPEAEAIDKWFEDLQHYEQTLEEMANASLDQNFKEELGAIEQWFRVLSEAERTAALYSLLQHSTQVQIRFFITVLQQMARSDPMGALLSPANPEKDMMSAQLAGAMAKADVEAKLAGMALKSPTSPTYPRRLYDRHSGVEFLSPDAAIYSDPAAALAQQRARLHQANAGNRGGLYSSRPKSMVAEGDQTVWAPATSGNQNNSKDNRTPNGRPKSADLSALPWTPGYNLRSPRPGGAFDGELSPLVGGSWASMVSTPVVPMFAEKQNAKASEQIDLAAKKLSSWSISNSSGNRVVLESDVKKFRRNHGKNNNQSGVPATVQEEKYAAASANIVLSMYDEHGNLRSPQQSPLPSPKVSARQGSRPASPNSANQNQSSSGGLYAVHPGWNQAGGGGKTNYLAPPGVNMRYDGNGDVAGYHSDNSDTSHKPNSKAPGKNKKKQNDDSVDFDLLQDIPAWLRSLRLHKYTPMFEGMKWQEIIELDDTQLEQKGVAALGARRKMLKEFEKVKNAIKEQGVSAS
ncbi:8290_t:CDS:2 [Paraglomus occultum]|uniref:RNA-binding protein VTS1 n=1 Tax=Paraglomus occultum TaxID=144539 RepID=A0A9N8WQN5_9GLOM|nr:8290_t:CDS:2 [Paraglomus occultum]